MATLPAANYLTDGARTEGEVKASLEAWLSATKQIPGAAQVELTNTISGGAITPAGGGGVVVIDTESAAASDDLTNIVTTNYPDGACLLLRNSNAARFVVLKHAATGAGQIFLAYSVDHVLDDTKSWLLLQRRGADWYEIIRGPARLRMPAVVKTATYTVTQADNGKVIECSGNFTVSFPAASTLGNGWVCTFVNVNSDGNAITLDPNGTETIDRQTTVILHAQKSVMVVCDGSEFFTVGGYAEPRRTTVSFSSTIIIDRIVGDYFEVGALTGNVTTFTVSNSAIEGRRTRIRFVQDATGGRTVAAPSGAKIAGSLASAANQASVLDLTYSFAGGRLEGFWTQIPL